MKHGQVNSGSCGMRCWNTGWLLILVILGHTASGWSAEASTDSTETDWNYDSRLSDKPDSLHRADFPNRPRLLLELGAPFLGRGPLRQGITLPTGAVWQPAMWVFGTYRTALQSFDGGSASLSEWAHRLDIFGNLRLSGTERVVIGFRPFDETGNVGYNFRSGDGWKSGFNGTLEHLFFEGEIGELFPSLDHGDSRAFDIGFSVGRQNLFFQDGMLINDNVDGIGLTRNTLISSRITNMRITALYAWNNVHRDDNTRDASAHLVGLFTEADTPFSTISVDLVYILAGKSTGDAFYASGSAVQRIGRFNTTFRVSTSLPMDGNTSASSRGTLLFNELSWTPHHGHNLFYINSFWALDRFSSAARGPSTGGPLGRTGILFAATGMGQYGAPLDNRANDAFGGSFGYQMFFSHTRKQLIIEIGGRKDTNKIDDGAAAVGLRYQQAVGRRFIVQVDTFGAKRQKRKDSFGGRLELLVKF